MNERIEDLMYESGLTADGCWEEMDDYDQKAIEKLVHLVIAECCVTADANIDDSKYPSYWIKRKFGVKE